ncbi:MAG: endopeptidase La [Thiotrichales bacterium]|nr:endopeptidase La [Thiotrichales bacterium]
MKRDTERSEPRVVTPDGEVRQELVLPGDVLPINLHLLPVTDRPFFPAHAMPVLMDEKRWTETVIEVGKHANRTVGLVLVDDDPTAEPSPEQFSLVGTAVRMHEANRRDGQIHFVAEGLQRFRIVRWLSEKPPYLVRVEYLPEVDSETEDPEIKAYAMAIIGVIKELIPLNPLYNEQLKLFLDRFTPNQPSSLSYFAASLTTAGGAELQAVLDAPTLLQRMDKVLVLIKKELEVAKLHAHISKQVEEAMGEQQRKFFLREQLKVIQNELGISKDDREADIELFSKRLDALKLPESVRTRADEELDKLGMLERGSPEYAVTRNYLDWISSLPFGVYSKDKLDLRRARKILNDDHAGLEDVKDRIIEFLAVGKLKGEISGSIILLVGPPGVGKTSVGRSVATALGREFYRFSLGGMRDEAEIKGHRRTYIGAMPGKLIQALKEVEVANPVIMLDEIDKIGASFHGDPASALLEVLDPEQNQSFLDHYLDVRFDLSRVLFICTANQLDTIPAALLDRMEVIRLSGYITEEKLAIARQHLWPELLQKSGLKSAQLKLTDAGLRQIINGYARQSGVRDLEKRLAQIVRKAAVKIVKSPKTKLRINANNIEDFLGPVLFRPETPMRGVGVVTGLAWTSLGGATLSVEASEILENRRGFRLTGRLGDVMQESAQIAYSFATSNVEQFGAPVDYFDQREIHLHVPEGATPKDGPSAGVTMATALLSLARGKAVKPSVAMTGELTLTGLVLAVGGIREKVIAARRGGYKTLILPAANRGDYDELPAYLRKGLKVHFAEKFADVARVALPT